MGKFVHKSHSVSVLMSHIVCPAKYRRTVFTPPVDKKLKEVCLEISKRYEITFLEMLIFGNATQEEKVGCEMSPFGNDLPFVQPYFIGQIGGNFGSFGGQSLPIGIIPLTKSTLSVGHKYFT